MKLLIDLQGAQSGSRLGGIGRYSLNLTKAILEIGEDHDIYVLLNGQLPAAIDSIKRELSDCIPQERVILFDSIPGVAELKCTNLAKIKSAEICREYFIDSLRPDAVVVMSLIEGLGDDVVVSIPKDDKPYINAVILYDLIPLAQQHKYLTDQITNSHYLRKLEQFHRADLLFSISQFSKDEGHEFLHLPDDRIVNISSAISDQFKPLSLKDADKAEITKRFGILEKYLMYVGSYDQRKNHKKLIEAFSLLPINLKKSYDLVFVGNGWKPIYDELSLHARECGLREGCLKFLGKVDDDDLVCLYNACSLFVFPSLFEGFGLPILEAMSCGTPAIGSNATSIPEVIGRDDALFDPTSANSIAEKIKDVLVNDEFYLELKKHAIRHANKFSWHKSAARVIAALLQKISSRAQIPCRVSRGYALGKIAGELAHSDEAAGFIQEISNIFALNEYLSSLYSASDGDEVSKHSEVLGIVSTWNQRCGISTYSKFILRDYPGSKFVFAPKTEGPTCEDEQFVFRSWVAGGADDLAELVRCIKHAGVTTLLIQFNYGFFDFNALSAAIKELIASGIVCHVELHSTVDPPTEILDRKLVDLVEAFNSCGRVFVHSERDAERLRGIRILGNVSLLYHGVNVPVVSSSSNSNLKAEFVVASYGFFLPHKGILETIRAFAELDIGPKRLLLVNSEYPADVSRQLVVEAEDLVRDLGVEGYVDFFTDFLPDEESFEILQRADVIVYPYQVTGESASGAIRLGLATMKPVLVTPLSIFDDVSNLVFKTKSVSVEDIKVGILDIRDKIREGDSAFMSVLQRRKSWLRARGYSLVSRFLFVQINSFRKLINGYRSYSDYSFGEMNIGTISGVKRANAIYSTDSDGVVAFGPYVGLSAGSHRLIVRGYVESEIRPKFDLFLRHTDGSINIPYSALENDDGVLVALEFFLDAPVNNFEVQVIKFGGGAFVMNSMVIESSKQFFLI